MCRKYAAFLIIAMLLFNGVHASSFNLITAIEQGDLKAFSQHFNKAELSLEDLQSIKTLIKARKTQLAVMTTLIPNEINNIKVLKSMLMGLLAVTSFGLTGYSIYSAVHQYPNPEFAALLIGVSTTPMVIGLYLFIQGIRQCMRGFHPYQILIKQYNNIQLIEAMVEKD